MTLEIVLVFFPHWLSVLSNGSFGRTQFPVNLYVAHSSWSRLWSCRWVTGRGLSHGVLPLGCSAVLAPDVPVEGRAGHSPGRGARRLPSREEGRDEETETRL